MSHSYDEWNGIPVRADEDMPPDEFEVMYPDEPIEDVRRRAWARRRRRLVQPTDQAEKTCKHRFLQPTREPICPLCGAEL